MRSRGHDWKTDNARLTVGLVGFLVAVLVLASSNTGLAQIECSTEQKMELGGCDPQNPPSRFTLFHDDEIAFLSFSNNTPTFHAQVFLPNTDYALPSGSGQTFDFTVPQPPTTPSENAFSSQGVAGGRFVDPTRSTVMVLTKVSFGLGTSTHWSVQEISYAPFNNPFPLPARPCNRPGCRPIPSRQRPLASPASSTGRIAGCHRGGGSGRRCRWRWRLPRRDRPGVRGLSRR